mmetsp:Transcript_4042/g.5551  ORF Transcript_4042/g.5551 Transcript_4042/m.5551 type:complete len:94 (-) Transcript_4042:406-687(-)
MTPPILFFNSMGICSKQSLNNRIFRKFGHTPSAEVKGNKNLVFELHGDSKQLIYRLRQYQHLGGMPSEAANAPRHLLQMMPLDLLVEESKSPF